MDLVTLRQKFIELCGRYDLVVDTTDWADNGADFFINAGQNYLDERVHTYWKWSRLFYELAADTWYQEFTACRAIESCYINNDTGRSKLERKDWHWLHQEFGSPIADTDSGTPLYYCPSRLREDENTDVDEQGIYFNRTMDDSQEYKGVIILPPPDEAIVLEVTGTFYSATLSDDADESFWTKARKADVLILAALYQLETLGHRNTAGANDYMNALNVKIREIESDQIEEDIQDFNQIEG